MRHFIEFGYSNQIKSESFADGLELKMCRITNAVKCLPPQNKPTGTENQISAINFWLPN